MNEQQRIITVLEQSPQIIRGLIQSIPKDGLKIRRKAGKWSIHEHACHLAEAEAMIFKRFQVFKKSDKPKFTSYIPGKTVETTGLMTMDLGEALDQYEMIRKKLLELIMSFDAAIWGKPAIHPEYTEYNALILLRHTLMHDHFHMYRMEELWLTKEECL